MSRVTGRPGLPASSPPTPHSSTPTRDSLFDRLPNATLSPGPWAAVPESVMGGGVTPAREVDLGPWRAKRSTTPVSHCHRRPEAPKPQLQMLGGPRPHHHHPPPCGAPGTEEPDEDRAPAGATSAPKLSVSHHRCARCPRGTRPTRSGSSMDTHLRLLPGKAQGPAEPRDGGHLWVSQQKANPAPPPPTSVCPSRAPGEAAAR